MSTEGPWFDLAMDPGENDRWRTFADWLDRCITVSGTKEAEVAKRYADLHYLISPTDQRRRRGASPQQTQIREWRSGQKLPRPEVAYRLGRALQDAGVPVCGLDALIASHYLIDLLGIIGSHIFMTVQCAPSALHVEDPKIEHTLSLLTRLKPRISRELTVFKLQATRAYGSIGELDLDDFFALREPLPAEILYAGDQTKLVDSSFVRWAYDRENARKTLPPRIKATITLLEGTPTGEVVDLAATGLMNLEEDLTELLRLRIAPWVLETAETESHPEPLSAHSKKFDMTALNEFFDEYENMFSIWSGKTSFRQSAAYPHVNVKLCGSDYHVPGTAIDIDWLVIDEPMRGQGLDKKAIIYFQDLARKYGVTLVTWPANDKDAQLFRGCGFRPCPHPTLGLGGRLVEWPKCAHKTP